MMWWMAALALAQDESFVTDWVDASTQAWLERGIEQPMLAEDVGAVQTVEWVGAQLYMRDVAAWHATDALVAAGVDPGSYDGLLGYVTGVADERQSLPVHWLVQTDDGVAIRWTVQMRRSEVVGWPTSGDQPPDPDSTAALPLATLERTLWTCRQALLAAVDSTGVALADVAYNVGVVPVDVEDGTGAVASLYPALGEDFSVPVGGVVDLWCVTGDEGVLVTTGPELQSVPSGGTQGVHYRSATLDMPGAGLMFQHYQAGVPLTLLDAQHRLWGFSQGRISFLGAAPKRRGQARRAMRKLRRQSDQGSR